MLPAISNAVFDASLRERNAEWGVRDIEALEQLVADAGLVLLEIAEMPDEMLRESCMAFSSMLSPWHEIVDPAQFDVWVDRIVELAPKVIVGAQD